MVTAAGSFQSELGCPADWSPDCLRSWLEDPDGDGTFTFTTAAHSCRRLPGEGRDRPVLGCQLRRRVAFLAVPNIDFTVPAAGSPVTFSYVAATHVLTVMSGNGLPSLKTAEGVLAQPATTLAGTLGDERRRRSLIVSTPPRPVG